MAKVQISIDDDLLRRTDEYADENYMSRSGLVSIALNQYLQTQGMHKHVKDLAVSMRRIADSGQIDEESQKLLANFEWFVKSITGTK